MTEPVPPGRWWGDHVGETRWVLEAARLRTDPVWRGRDVPRGDGRGVVLVPGFGGGDYTLAALAGWLRRIGYRPAVCGFVLNADCSERALERVERRVAALHARLGPPGGDHRPQPRRALRARGGGAPARARVACRLAGRGPAGDVRLQRADPGRCRGRAARAGDDRARAAPECVTYRCPCAFTAAFRAPFPTDRVRLTSVYSKRDGVVRWQAQLVPVRRLRRGDRQPRRG